MSAVEHEQLVSEEPRAVPPEPPPSPHARALRRHPLGDRGLGIVLLVLFLVSWIGQFFVQLVVVRNEASEHGQPFQWGDFLAQFWHSTLENWQSEFLQLLTFVVLTTYLIYRGSHESKDADLETDATLERIEAKLDALGAEVGRGRAELRG
jgi:hypothetical protein